MKAEPSKVRILGIDYKIEFVPEIDGSGSIGRCTNNLSLIQIRTVGQKKQHQQATMVHEILEALDYRLELGLEHKVITQLESGLLQVMKDNSSVIDWIKG